MIKYLGSKRRLVPVLGAIVRGGRRAHRARPLHRHDTRRAGVQAARRARHRGRHRPLRRGVRAHATSRPTRDAVDRAELAAASHDLDALPGDARLLHRDVLRAVALLPARSTARASTRSATRSSATTPARRCYPVLLTSLIEAADRVDSTTGVQMAYVKQWAPRSYRAARRCACPSCSPGAGRRGPRRRARRRGARSAPFDLAYLDPPYNQHRYFTNYHVWETLVAWDAPEHYGVACKRVDARDDATKSVFNRRRLMPDALARVIRAVDAGRRRVVQRRVVGRASTSCATCAPCTATSQMLAFDSRRYVGAQIGIHNPQGEQVGTVSHVRNQEYVVIAGGRTDVRRLIDASQEVAVGA